MAGYLWSRDSQVHRLCERQCRRRKFNVLCRGSQRALTPLGADAPPSRDLTNLKGVRVMLFSAPKSRSGRDLHRPQRSRQILARSLQTPDLHRRAHADPPEYRSHCRLDLRSCRAICAWPSAFRIRAIRKSCEWMPAVSRPFTPATSLRACDVVQFHKDAQRAYIQTNKGDLDLLTLALLDPATGEIESVESDPLRRVDFGSRMVFRSDRRTGGNRILRRSRSPLFQGSGLRGRLSMVGDRSFPARKSR